MGKDKIFENEEEIVDSLEKQYLGESTESGVDKEENIVDTTETDVQEESVQEESVNELKTDFLIEESRMVATEPIKNGPPKKYMARIIGPGWGSSGFYSEDILKKAVEDGVFHMGMHSYIDHPTTTEKRERRVRSVRDQLGFLGEDAIYDSNGDEGPGVYAPLSIFPDRRGFVSERAKSTGLSMHVLCEFRKGKAAGKFGNIVERMVKEETNSVDMVSVAGAGGKFGSILESKTTPETNTKEEEMGNETQAENNVIEESKETGEEKMGNNSGFDVSQLDSPIAHEMYESKRQNRMREEKMAGELRDLKVHHICRDELTRQALMEVTRVHLEELLPDQIKKESDCFDEDGQLNEPKTREFITESIDHHLRYLEALDRERTHGVSKFQVVEESGTAVGSRIRQNPLEAAFSQHLGHSPERAKAAFGN